jgi:lysophospholipase L1-like esterase
MRPTFLGLLCMAALLSAAEPAPRRVLALGDSITDGDTWPILVMQAVREAQLPPVAVINAAAGGFTAEQMLASLPGHLALYKPDRVALMGGTNDALREVAPEAWIASVERIAATCRAANVAITIAIPCLITDQNVTDSKNLALRAAARARRERYIELLTDLAKRQQIPLADVGGRLAEFARQAEIMAGDGIHPGYHGQRAIARAWLDGLGWPQIALPTTFKPPVYPGLITRWQVRPAPLDAQGKPVALTAETAAALVPDAGWTVWTLPEAEPVPPPSAAERDEWNEQLRRTGFCVVQAKQAGNQAMQAVAEIDGGGERWISTGGGNLMAVWLDGALILRKGDWHGYHLGADRIKVDLPPGKHRLAVEAAGAFIVTVNDRVVWEELVR